MRRFIAYPREDWKTCDELRKPLKQLCRLFGVTCSTGNAFADFCLADPGENQTKPWLVMGANHIITDRSFKQVEATAQLGVPHPKVSALVNYRLDGFSVETLVHFNRRAGARIGDCSATEARGKEATGLSNLVRSRQLNSA